MKDSSTTWTTIAECATVLESIRADEKHLVLLKKTPEMIIAEFLESQGNIQMMEKMSCHAMTRLEDIKRVVGVGNKRSTNSSNPQAIEREKVRCELAQHGLLFDFPIVQKKLNESLYK